MFIVDEDIFFDGVIVDVVQFFEGIQLIVGMIVLFEVEFGLMGIKIMNFFFGEGECMIIFFFDQFVLCFVGGFNFGFLLVLVLMGVVFIYGMMCLLNFVYVEMVIWGGLVVFVMMLFWYFLLWFGIVVVVVGGGLFGWVLDVGIWCLL